MILYDAHVDPDSLTHWPFDNPESRYKIKEGAPRASGRLDAGGPGHETRLGIWHCTQGAFECIEQGDELMTVISGRCRLENHTTGQTVGLVVGDTLFIRDGSHVTWTIEENVTKVFHGYKPGGY